MAKPWLPLVVATLLLGAMAYAEDEDDKSIKVGAEAPAVAGKKWFGTDKAPDLKGKVYLVDFWFAG